MQGQHKVSKQPKTDLMVKQLLPTPTLRIQCSGSKTMFWIKGDFFRSPSPGQKSCRDLSGGQKDASSLSAAFLLLLIQHTLLKIGKKKIWDNSNFFKSNVNSIHKEVH